MALSKLSDDLILIIFSKLCNVAEISDTRLVLYPGDAVAFSSASSELRALTKAELLELLQLRKAWLEAAARKAGKRSYMPNPIRSPVLGSMKKVKKLMTVSTTSRNMKMIGRIRYTMSTRRRRSR